MRYLLHHSVDESATRYPAHEAMRFRGIGLTYAGLAQRSAQLARLLHDQGVRRGDRIGVFLNKSLETVVAIYGVLRAGAAYVPLDPRSPAARLVGIIQDCDMHGVISQDDKAAILADVAEEAASLKFLVGLSGGASVDGVRTFSWDDVAEFPPQPPAVRVMEHDLAYIMYTSGTTGAPKGIMHTHYSGLSYVRMSAATYDIRHEDRLSNHPALHFDMSTFDYLTGPYCGTTTVIIPESHMLFPAELSRLVQDERLTVWYSVPFALSQMLLNGALDDRDWSSLRWVLYGGEPFPVDHLRALLNRLPWVRFSNVYGPAEVNQCTVYNIPAPAAWPDDFSDVPLGDIWDNADGLVVDDEDQPPAAGAVGELLVRTPTMMRGYWNRPDLNERVFYYQALAGGFSATYFRTGDLVRTGDDGLLYFMGRKDHQVKVRGFRIELPEIDRVLGGHPVVEAGAGFVTRGEQADELCAAVVLVGGHTGEAGALKAHLQSHLPHYAVPDRIVFVQALPRTSAGKVDRKALQRQFQQQSNIE